MKPKSVVTCLPTKNIEKSLTFYSECFKLEGLKIEDDMFTIELANLSLFVMSQEAYEQYTKQVNMSAFYPDDSVQVIHSCALEDTAMIEHLFTTAEQFGGTVAQQMRQNKWGQDAGYLCDPDGHLWEIVRVA
ncbi:MAG TPA: VOC family protein [Candidatus Saccharimonadales bacterium]|nr:VOC family protein [Candidatus Saccharimonadales bacterium]